mmetsp:Transcript_13792/g.39143  ORF Transcript_13792/g.39143 Transcript_13792/m.39143 type:complete len:206 (-) Transcript_13792:178-795(-)
MVALELKLAAILNRDGGRVFALEHHVGHAHRILGLDTILDSGDLAHQLVATASGHSRSLDRERAEADRLYLAKLGKHALELLFQLFELEALAYGDVADEDSPLVLLLGRPLFCLERLLSLLGLLGSSQRLGLLDRRWRDRTLLGVRVSVAVEVARGRRQLGVRFLLCLLLLARAGAGFGRLGAVVLARPLATDGEHIHLGRLAEE